jgi:Xaa-Pro aminopeptidase
MEPRISQLLKKLKPRGLDGLFVSDPYNVSYLTGFRSRDSYLLVSSEKSVYFTDSRYIEDARRMLRGVTVKKFQPSPWQSAAREASRMKLTVLGFEDSHLSFNRWRCLADSCAGLPSVRGTRVVLKPASGLVEEMRLVKSSQEVTALRKACAITMDALRFAREAAVPGRTELELAGELERFIRYHGAFTSSFDIIVASGPNSSLPHHVTSSRRIREGEHVYVDMGVDYEGYRSDLTRVFFVGTIPLSVQRVYKTVAEAQGKAIRHIRPGAMAAEIDDCARRYLCSRGLGKYFGHALGHGVGLEIHEGPRIAPGIKTVLKEGMVFTVEPAVYIPGKFGVRVEDMVLVTRNGSEVLSGSLNK